MILLSTLKAKLRGSYKSLTIWFNSTGIVLLTAAMSEPLLHEWLIENNFSVIWLLGNLIIRIFKTSSALEDK